MGYQYINIAYLDPFYFSFPSSHSHLHKNLLPYFLLTLLFFSLNYLYFKDFYKYAIFNLCLLSCTYHMDSRSIHFCTKDSDSP